MLQRCDQDFLNVCNLSMISKNKQLQEMKNEEWKELIYKVIEICNMYDIDVLDMKAPYA